MVNDPLKIVLVLFIVSFILGNLAFVEKFILKHSETSSGRYSSLYFQNLRIYVKAALLTAPIAVLINLLTQNYSISLIMGVLILYFAKKLIFRG
jgi:hypothetical protein